jgi:hypothetical protein
MQKDDLSTTQVQNDMFCMFRKDDISEPYFHSICRPCWGCQITHSTPTKSNLRESEAYEINEFVTLEK